MKTGEVVCCFSWQVRSGTETLLDAFKNDV